MDNPELVHRAPDAPVDRPVASLPPEPAPVLAPHDPKLIASAAFQRSAPPAGHRPRPSAPPGSEPKLVLKVVPDGSPGPNEVPVEPTPGPEPQRSPQSSPAAGPGTPPAPPADTSGFHVPPTESWAPVPAATGRSAGSRRRRPGRWAAAVAAVAAVLLLAVALVVSRADDRKTALRLDATTTSLTADTADTSTVPEATTDGGPVTAPPASTVPSVPVPGAAGTTAPVAPTTTPPRPVAAAGALFPVLASVGLPPVDSTTGTQRGVLPLRNRGGSPLTYATRSSFAGLSVDKPTGTIAPGATIQLTVTLDGTRAPEGNFSGTLTFDGSGGSGQVAVTALVGRPPAIRDDAGESCTNGIEPCSRLLQLVPGPNPDPRPSPCNTPWRYSVTVEDESRLKFVRAQATIRGLDAELRKDGATSGTAGRWQSAVFPPLPVTAAVKVTIDAVDEFDFGRFQTSPTIQC